MEGEKGHRKMVVWKNLDQVEQMVYWEILKKIPKNAFSLIDQIDRACSSSMANFIEGYYSGSRREYVKFLKYSKRSLAELQDWIRRCYYKGFISKELYEKADDLLIRTIYLENRLISALQFPPIPKPS
ncbi:MAG: four helix bundle protein [Candidatus Margulisiibacteriota bacterium]